MSEEEVPHIVNLDFKDLYPEVQMTHGIVGTSGMPGVMGVAGKQDAEYHLRRIVSIKDVLDIIGDRESKYIQASIKSSVQESAKRRHLAGISSIENQVQEALAHLGTDYSNQESWNLMDMEFLGNLIEKLKMKAKSEKFGL